MPIGGPFSGGGGSDIGAGAVGDVYTTTAPGVSDWSEPVIFDAPPTPTFAEKVVAWLSCLAGGATTTTAFSTGTIHYNLHYEEVGRVYDALIAFTSAGVGLNIVLAVYSIGSDGNPAALLWTSPASSTNVSNTQHILTFANGTWTAAGDSYKDGDDNLVLIRGRAVYLAVQSSGNVTYRILQATQIHNHGFRVSLATTGYTGFTEATTYPTFPATATPVSGTGSIPILGIRWTERIE